MSKVWLLNLADWCREALGDDKVTEWPGWQTTSRSSGGYDDSVKGIIVHYSAGNRRSSDYSQARYEYEGHKYRPVGSIHLNRDGSVFVGAAGATNTAGKGGPWQTSVGYVPLNSGNRHTLNIEASNDGVGEVWGAEMCASYVKLCAVLCLKLGLQASDVIGHLEWAPGRKQDPAGPTLGNEWDSGPKNWHGVPSWNMDLFRADIAAEIARRTTPTPPPLPSIKDDSTVILARNNNPKKDPAGHLFALDVRHINAAQRDALAAVGVTKRIALTDEQFDALIAEAK